MTPRWLVFALAVFFGSPTRAVSQAAVTIAVLPLDNGGSYGKDKEEFDGLRRGIAGLIGSELTRGAVAVVPRERTQRLVDDQGTAVAERIDAQTASRIGKTVGARFVIVGTFIDLYGDFRLDARIVDTTTGEILRVVKSDPRLSDRKQLFRIVQSVAQRIIEGLNAGTSAAGTRDISTEAVVWYGKALLYLDRGDKKRALDGFNQALKAAPGFAEAIEGVKKAGAA